MVTPPKVGPPRPTGPHQGVGGWVGPASPLPRVFFIQKPLFQAAWQVFDFRTSGSQEVVGRGGGWHFSPTERSALHCQNQVPGLTASSGHPSLNPTSPSPRAWVGVRGRCLLQPDRFASLPRRPGCTVRVLAWPPAKTRRNLVGTAPGRRAWCLPWKGGAL